MIMARNTASAKTAVFAPSGLQQLACWAKPPWVEDDLVIGVHSHMERMVFSCDYGLRGDALVKEEVREEDGNRNGDLVFQG